MYIQNQVSFACMSLCKWVLALEHYHNVQQMIVPRQNRVKEAVEALEISKVDLNKKQVTLLLIALKIAFLLMYLA